jgi:hypothetical protein
MKPSTRAVLDVLAVALLPIAAACGGGGDEPDATGAPAGTEAAPSVVDTVPAATEAAPATDAPDTTPATDPPATDPTATDPPATDPPAAAAAVGVELDEWTIVLDAPLTAGAVDFNVANVGAFTHELVVIQGDSYATLPQTPNGAVNEAALPAGALLAKSDKFESGQGGTLSVELAPGNYVLLCNIAVGPNSHAGAGQVLDVTVS